MLDGLHEDLNLVINKPAPVEYTAEREAELETLPTQIAAEREWNIYLRRDDSIIVRLLQGQYKNQLRCLTCGTASPLLVHWYLAPTDTSLADFHHLQYFYVSLPPCPDWEEHQ